VGDDAKITDIVHFIRKIKTIPPNSAGLICKIYHYNRRFAR